MQSDPSGPLIKVLDAVSIMALQLFRESYIGLSSITVKDNNPVHPENAEFPMVVTLLGMVNEARLLQPENAEFPILITLLGMVNEARLLQPEKE